MKKFTEVISIEVPVQSIADLLLDNMHPDFQHKELVTEAIVGRMMADGSLSFLYNSLNGYPCNVDFQVGDLVRSQNGFQVYGYWTPESIEKNDSVYGYVYNAEVVEINPYSNEKLRIKYEIPNKNGSFDTSVKWVKHTAWNRVAVEAAL
jgi:hypothetical protein